MPLQKGITSKNKKPVGYYQYGDLGKKYIFDLKDANMERQAKDLAHRQAIAINLRKIKNGGVWGGMYGGCSCEDNAGLIGQGGYGQAGVYGGRYFIPKIILQQGEALGYQPMKARGGYSYLGW